MQEIKIIFTQSGQAIEKSSQRNYRISFSIIKNLSGSLNSCTVKIFNLDLDDAQSLMTYGTQLEAVLIDDNGTYSLFRGHVKYAIHKRQSADIYTEFYAESGMENIKAPISQSFNASKISEIIPAIASNAQLKYSQSNIIINGFTNSTVLTGTTKDVLDDLAKLYGFSWSIQDGELIAIDDNSTLPNVVNNQNHIISVTRIADKPDTNGFGINVNLTISPEFKVGAGFKVNSFLNPNISGTVFKCHKIIHSGDSGATNFETTLVGYLPGKTYKKSTPEKQKSFLPILK